MPLNINKKVKVSLIILITIIIISFLMAAYYVVFSRYIKYDGITIKPSKDFAIHEVNYYLQNDRKWADDFIGSSTLKMGSAGCLITCVASSITDLGIRVSPKDVNNSLTNVDGYDGSDLIWYKINEAFPEIDYKYSRIFNNKTIENDLKNNRLPIVNVKYNGTGITHWVVILGAQDKDFLIFDPLKKEAVPLKTHGKIYAYRVLVKT